jgi:DNA primase small subunit
VIQQISTFSIPLLSFIYLEKNLVIMSRTLDYVKQSFADYYRKTDLGVPQRFGRREWGFFFFTGAGMQRHIQFDRIDDLRDFLVANTPKHVYYSSAYYQYPDMQPMAQKVEGWLGSDLIFDLDDEHLSGTKGLSISERLEKVKRILKDRLLDDFLLKDFGFKPEFIKVTFSGGRGYHIHIFDPKVLNLESPERREIVDYITATGLDDEKIFQEQVFQVKSFGPHSVAKKTMNKLSDESAPGWKGRMTRGIMALLDEMESLDDKECIELLKSVKIPDKVVTQERARTIYNQLFKGIIGQRGADIIRDEKVIEILAPDLNRDIFVELATNMVDVKMAGETDEPVTIDTKRLIRFPSSLHGKTGLRVVSIPLEKLDDFEPMRDAVAFEETPVEIVTSNDLSFELGGNNFDLSTGQNTVPKYCAVYLMCRGEAELA